MARCDLQLDSTTELEEEQFKDKRLVIFDKARHGAGLPIDSPVQAQAVT